MFSGSYDKTVRVWDVDELVCLATLQGHSGAVRALTASPTLVFSGSDDTTIKARTNRESFCIDCSLIRASCGSFSAAVR